MSQCGKHMESQTTDPRVLIPSIVCKAVPGMPGGSAAELAAGGWHAASPQPLPPAQRLPCAAGPAPYRAALVRFTRCAMAAIVRRQQLLEQDEEWFGMQKRTPSAAAAAPVDWVCARAPARYLRLLLHSPSPAEEAPTENCWKFRSRWWSYGQLLWRRSSHVADAPARCAHVQVNSLAQQHRGQKLHTSARCEERLLLRSARVFTRFSCSRASCHALVLAVTSSLQAGSAR